MSQRVPVRANGESNAAPKPSRVVTAGPGSTPAEELSWDYAPAPERVPVKIADRCGLFIAGEFVEPLAGEHFATVNPATGETLSEVAQGAAADVDRAVAAAREALPAWAALPAKERGKSIYRIARRIQERARELAVLETMDGGKPIKESRDVDVPLAAAHFFYYAGWADKLAWGIGTKARRHEGTEGEVAPGVLPMGVCGQIIPWNFPLMMAAWKLAPALACGNTCVLKPAETTPLTALRLGEICQEIGLPAGVVNIVTGDGRTGRALVEHPDVDKIAFTGSTEVGKKIARALANEHRIGSASRSSHKSLTLELGGKSPNIIFEDASLDQAIEGIIAGIYFNQGHVCCAGSRLFVQESILEAVIEKLGHRLKSLRVGDPLDKNTDVGAINSPQQLATIRRYLDAGVGEGAELHVPGRSALRADASADARDAILSPEFNGHPSTPSDDFEQDPSTRRADLRNGNWCRPCFFTGVQPSHVVAREEIFGPVLSVMSFRTPEEAILRANNTPYGLAAGVWTDKGSKIFEIASKLKAGVIWLNTYNKFDPASPFGGYKESGFGREGGVHGLRAYVR